MANLDQRVIYRLDRPVHHFHRDFSVAEVLVGTPRQRSRCGHLDFGACSRGRRVVGRAVLQHGVCTCSIEIVLIVVESPEVPETVSVTHIGTVFFLSTFPLSVSARATLAVFRERVSSVVVLATILTRTLLSLDTLI